MSNFGNCVQEFYVQKFRRNLLERQAQISQLKTREEAEAFVRKVRGRLASCWPLPQAGGPLNVRVVGTIRQKGYEIRKILFDGFPGCPVSASLYIPDGLTGKAPAVLVLTGHDKFGKGGGENQTLCISFALKGYIVFLPDPVGQGERFQYPDVDGFCNCPEHNLFNRRMLLLGSSFGTWRVFEAVRSVDFLCSLPQVDTARIGVTGVSGGGTMTSLLAAVEPRLACAAPACYITRWVRNVENELPVDGEQIPPGAACDGGEMADLLLAYAPRPVLIMGQKDDFFDVRGTKEVYEELKHLYGLLGCPEKVELAVGSVDHSYSIEIREACYDFFNRTLGMPGDGKEPEGLEILKPEELFCTPNGRTVELTDTRTVNQILAEQVRSLVASRPFRTPQELRAKLKDMLGIGEVQLPCYRQLRPRYIPEELRGFARYGVETEPGILVTMFYSNRACFHIPAAERTELYIPHRNSFEELKTRPLPQGRNRFALDYRGVGESEPDGCDQHDRGFDAYYRHDYHYSSLGLLFNEPYLGGRVRDVLAAIRLLRANGNPNITLTASGDGCIVALLAAFLSEEPVGLSLPQRLVTYREHALATMDGLPQSFGIPGILAVTDLDEIQDLQE